MKLPAGAYISVRVVPCSPWLAFYLCCRLWVSGVIEIGSRPGAVYQPGAATGARLGGRVSLLLIGCFVRLDGSISLVSVGSGLPVGVSCLGFRRWEFTSLLCSVLASLLNGFAAAGG